MAQSNEQDTTSDELYQLLKRVAETAYCNGAGMEYPSDLEPITPVEAEALIKQHELEAKISELDWALSRLNTFGKETDSQALNRAIDEFDDNIEALKKELEAL